MTSWSPPDGFELHFRKSPLTKPWEPLYSRRTKQSVTIGLRINEQHCNARGFVHGGLVAALADNAMGLSCATRFDPAPSLVTTNLAVDFFGIAKRGQWVEFATDFVKAGKTLCFAQCFVTADGVPAARANATLRVYTG